MMIGSYYYMGLALMAIGGWMLTRQPLEPNWRAIWYVFIGTLGAVFDATGLFDTV